MQTKLTLDIDEKTVELATIYAKRKGISLNELLKFYLNHIVWNKTLNQTFEIDKQKSSEKKIEKWNNLEKFLSENRFDLPENYQFDRNELHDR